MDPATTDSVPASKNPGTGTYADWVATRDSSLSGAFLMEFPTPDTVARVAQARMAGVGRIVCGFLPDEVDWPQYGWAADLEFFTDHMVFLPRVLDEVEADGSCETVLFIHDAPMDMGTPSASGALGESLSSVTGFPLECIDVANVSTAHLARRVASARWVINEVRNWTVGFAIDEWAWRVGARVLRFRDPGYSPIRAALLGHSILVEDRIGVSKLRPLLGRLTQPGESPRTSTKGRSWFRDGEALKSWGRWMGRATFSNFWSRWKATRVPATTQGQTLRWHDRAMALAALAAVAADPEFPGSALERLEATLAERLAVDLREGHLGWLAHQALPRWVVRRPQWIRRFRSETGDTREVREMVARWLTHGCNLDLPCDAMIAAVREASWALGAEAAELSASWRASWHDLPVEASDVPLLSVPARMLCLDGFLCRDFQGAEKNPLEAKAINDVLATPALWRRCFGGAAEALRVVAAWRHRRYGAIRTILRSDEAVRGAVRSGVLRLARSLFTDESDLTSWLVRHSVRPPVTGDVLCGEIINEWKWRRRWDYWRPSIPGTVECELRTAIALTDARAAKPGCDAETLRTLVTLLAVGGRGGETMRAMERYVACEGAVADLSGIAATGLSIRRDPSSARLVLERWPGTDKDGTIALFFRAIARELLGERERAQAELEALHRCASAFPPNGPGGEAILAWGSVVFRNGGDVAAASRLRSAALAISRASEQFMDGFSGGGTRPTAGWYQLFRIVPVDSD